MPQDQVINMRIPTVKGSYLLWFYLPKGVALSVGKLGLLHLKRGWYLYCGSAFGAGGLSARIGHHLKSVGRHHWHIDYLKAQMKLRAVWFCRGENKEHDWSQRLVSLPDAVWPVAGFIAPATAI